jgi:hypothetical protein
MSFDQTAIRQLLKHGQRLAGQFPNTPIIVAERKPEGAGQEFSYELTDPYSANTVRIRFNADRFGEFEGDEFSLRFAELRIDCAVVVTVQAKEAPLRFGVMVFGEDTVLQVSRGYSAWKKYSEAVAPVLCQFPELGLNHIPHATAMLAAFVFQSVYGTAFADEDPPHCMVENLWGATLCALRGLLAEHSPEKPAIQTSKKALTVAATPKLMTRGRGNPGISDAEADLRREILEKATKFDRPQDAVIALFDTYRLKILAVSSTDTKMKTHEDFKGYIATCKDWWRKGPGKSEQKKRKKS